ncbi:MAG: peptide deformylase [candidate division Zixibacteria bacterium]|jgi:peptide deformylase|nr:peptide deformylase [candidate division Zixibacteria bacterium]
MDSNQVRKYGDPVLREKCNPVTVFDDELREIAEKMFSIMRSAKGLGLAAPQVGDRRRLFMIDLSGQDFDSEPMIFVNPEIESADGEQMAEEGCLSFPGLFIEISRARKITVKYQDIEGKFHRIEATDLAARAIQHENDHLNGVLFIDYLSSIERDLLAGKLKKIKVG